MRKLRSVAALGVVMTVVFGLLTAFGIGAPSAGAYPATTCATISVSATNPTAGTEIAVTGAGFTPGVHLTLILESQPDTQGHVTVGLVTATAAGTFTFKFVVPNDLGQHILTAIGDVLSAVCPADPAASIDILGAGSQGVSSGGGLASTGADVVGAIVIALALIGLGAGLSVTGRRRRTRRSRPYVG